MATRNFVPRRDGEGSVGKLRKHWGTAYIDKIFVKAVEVLGGETENDEQPATVGWVKSKFQEMIKSTFSALGVRYVMGDVGYLCMGALFGNIKITWGITLTNQPVENKSIQVTLPIFVSTEYFSCGNVNVAGGTADGRWNSVKPVVSTILGDGKLNISSNYFEPSWRYGIRWLLIGV